MAGDRVICYCNNVTYIDIRKAMIEGARTTEEIQEMTGAGAICGRCTGEIETILKSVCSCHNVSLEDVLNAVKNGADTVEQVAAETKAGSACGRCKGLVQNIINLKK